MTVTGVIIAKNEEDRIVDCIKSISFCNDILVIDNNSTDNTALAAQKNGAKVVSAKTESFSELRNIAISIVESEWIFYIDADEQATKKLKDEIEFVINNKIDYTTYKVLRKNFYLGNNPWPQIEKLERLFYRKSLKKWYGDLHESPITEGKVGELSGHLLHFTHRNLEYMLAKTIKWSDEEARLRLKVNHPKVVWWRFFRVMSTSFYKSFFLESGWRVGSIGLIESMYQAYSIFVTYAKLWELQQLKNK